MGGQVAGNVNFHTGQPFNFNAGTQRPGLDLLCNPFVGVSQTFSAALGGTQWVNPNCFGPASDPAGIGTLSRNRFYGPGLFRWRLQRIARHRSR